MLKILASIASLFIGVLFYGIWAAGSHGHMRFRPNMLEDWIFSTIIIIGFVVPLIVLISRLNKRKKRVEQKLNDYT